MASEHRGRIFAGILLILIGVVFLLASLGSIDVGDLFAQYWPLIIVLSVCGSFWPTTSAILYFQVSPSSLLGVSSC